MGRVSAAAAAAAAVSGGNPYTCPRYLHMFSGIQCGGSIRIIFALPLYYGAAIFCLSSILSTNCDDVAKTYTTRPNREKAGKVLYIYLSWRDDRWDKEVHIWAPTHAQQCRGGILAWLGKVQL